MSQADLHKIARKRINGLLLFIGNERQTSTEPGRSVLKGAFI